MGQMARFKDLLYIPTDAVREENNSKKELFLLQYRCSLGFLGGSVIKNPPAKQTWVRSLGGEDPLEGGMATHSSIRAWSIPWTEEPCGLQSMGVTQNWTRLK